MVVKNNLPGEPIMKSKHLAGAWVQTVLDMSTCHVTEADTKILDKNEFDSPIVVYKYDEGYFIPIPNQVYTKGMGKGLVKYGYSKEFANIVDICMNQKYDFLRLDCDGKEYDQLPKFNW